MIYQRRPTRTFVRPRRFVLPVDHVSPFIRIAHRPVGPLNIDERIIFDHEFVLFLKGSGTFRTRENSHPISPGTLFFIPPFVPHSFETGKIVCDHIAIHFDWTRGLPPHSNVPSKRRPYEVRLADGLQIPLIFQCRKTHGLEKLFAHLIDSRSPFRVLEQRATLLQILHRLLQSSRQNSQADSVNTIRLDRVIEHLKTHFIQPIDAETLSKIAGLSPSHFTRVFREFTGTTPIQYVRQLRIEFARELLGQVDLSIKEVARRCGFDDQYHFSKVFHQIDGLSPSDFRQQLLAGR